MSIAAGSLLRKVARDGIGYSVVELSDVRHVFAAAVPHKGSTLEEQAEDALRTIAAVVDEEGRAGHGSFTRPCSWLMPPSSSLAGS